MTDRADIYNRPDMRTRAAELQQWTKVSLAALWKRHHPNAWTLHPVSTWSKHELAWDIVRAEVAQAEADALLDVLRAGDDVSVSCWPGRTFQVVKVDKPNRAVRIITEDGEVWVNAASVQRPAGGETR